MRTRSVSFCIALSASLISVLACSMIPSSASTGTPSATKAETPSSETQSPTDRPATATTRPTATLIPTPEGGGTGRVVFDSERDGNPDIYTMNIDGTDIIRLTEDEAVDAAPVWSPDGTKIGFLSDRDGGLDIYVMDADGSNLTRVTDLSTVVGAPKWSPDSLRIAFVADRNEEARDLYVVNADGSDLFSLVREVDSSPEWLPGGTRIAFMSKVSASDDLYTINVNGANIVQVTDEIPLFSPAWSPDGTQIAFVNDSYLEGGVYVMDADGSNVTRLTEEGEANTYAPIWSPDGTRIAYLSYLYVDDDTTFTDLFVMDADGSNNLQITDLPDHVYEYVWSPDGMQIAFENGNGNDRESDLYVINADGSNLRQLTDQPGSDGSIAWQPARSTQIAEITPAPASTRPPTATASPTARLGPPPRLSCDLLMQAGVESIMGALQVPLEAYSGSNDYLGETLVCHLQSADAFALVEYSTIGGDAAQVWYDENLALVGGSVEMLPAFGETAFGYSDSDAYYVYVLKGDLALLVTAYLADQPRDLAIRIAEQALGAAPAPAPTIANACDLLTVQEVEAQAGTLTSGPEPLTNVEPSYGDVDACQYATAQTKVKLTYLSSDDSARPYYDENLAAAQSASAWPVEVLTGLGDAAFSVADPEGGSFNLWVLKNDRAVYLWVEDAQKRSRDITMALIQNVLARLP